MYCQACGAENTGDARFCNMCGARFAQAGEAGGPIAGAPAAAATGAAAGAAAAGAAAAGGGPRNDPNATVLGVGVAGAQKGAVAPPAGVGGAQSAAGAAGAAMGGGALDGAQSPFGGDSMLGVTLGGIGVKSAKKTWITILAIAAGLVAAGALAMWLAMGSNDDQGGHAEADDPFVLGMPLTEETDGVPDEVVEGDPTPEDIDFVTGAGGSGTSAAAAGGGTSEATPTTRRARRSSRGSRGSTSRSASMAGATGGSGSGGSGSGASDTAGSDSSGGSAAGGSGSDTSGSTASGSGTSGSDTSGTDTSGSTMSGSSGGGSLPTNTTNAPEERDLELELYGSRVRYVVRRYYAARAQSCFDRATRNDPSVSGTVVVAMSIGSDGGVTRARVQRNTTGNDSLGNCLSSQVGTWRLPPPPGGSLDMTMPFSR